jgi:hypothetical protein
MEIATLEEQISELVRQLNFVREQSPAGTRFPKSDPRFVRVGGLREVPRCEFARSTDRLRSAWPSSD